MVRKSGGRSGEGVDEKSMARGSEVLLGVIGDKLQFVRFFPDSLR